MQDVQLHLGDCLDFMRTLPDGCVDAVVTDPPYSSGGAFRSDRSKSSSQKYVDADGHSAQLPEVVGDSRDALGWAFWSTLWASRCYAAMRPGGVFLVFTDWRQLPNLSNVVQAAGFVWRGIAVWDKGGSSRPMAGRFNQQAEYIIFATKGAMPWDFTKPSMPGVFSKTAVPTVRRVHQTEKPLDVMKWVLGVVDGNATVLDPFMGSGTTGVACVQTGRRFIGCEMDPTYYAIAKRRIEEAQAQPALLEVTA